MYKIDECPNCKSKHITLCGDDVEHPECYLLVSANKDTKLIDIHTGMPLHAFRCLDCNYISFFHAMPEKLDNSSENQK